MTRVVTDGTDGCCDVLMVGAGIAVEKAFQEGGQIVRDMGIRVESLARVAGMDPETGVRFC